MKDKKNDKSPYLMIFVAILTLYFLKDYISIVLITIVFAILVHPIYLFLNKKLKKPKVTTSIIFLIIILPILIGVPIIVDAIIDQSNSIAKSVAEYDFEQIDLYNQATAKIEETIDSDIQESIANYFPTIKSISNNLFNFVISSTGQISTGITSLILFTTIIYSLLPNMDKFRGFIVKLSPLKSKTTKLYLDRSYSMIKAMFKGTIIIALCQAILVSMLLLALGFKYTLIVGVITFIACLLPLGSFLAMTPIALYYLFSGHYFSFIIIVLFHLIITSNVDNVLRPKLVPKDIALHPALTLLGMFAGLSTFGIIGVIYGPTLMVLIVTTVEIYNQE